MAEIDILSLPKTTGLTYFYEVWEMFSGEPYDVAILFSLATKPETPSSLSNSTKINIGDVNSHLKDLKKRGYVIEIGGFSFQKLQATRRGHLAAITLAIQLSLSILDGNIYNVLDEKIEQYKQHVLPAHGRYLSHLNNIKWY